MIVGAQVSIDGVMQAPGGPSEDPTNGFTLGGWAIPYFDREAGEEIGRMFEQPIDLLLGRKTYEIFAAFSPFYDKAGEDGAIAKRFDEIHKYVVSGSGEVDASWQGSTVLRSLDDVKRLTKQDGPDLVIQGSTALTHALLAADLVDRISIFTIPIVLGRGKKLFADGSAPHEYKLTGSRVCPSGIVVTHFERGGAIKTADMALPSPTKAEQARQARMKREG
jgi:dihydrofolate reductase